MQRLAGLIGPRHLGRPSTLHAAAALIERELGEGGDVVERQAYSVGDQEVANLIIERRGTDRPGEIALLGGTDDTVPTTPGADDNASAVATLIEAARLLCGAGFDVRCVSWPLPAKKALTSTPTRWAARCTPAAAMSAASGSSAHSRLEMVGYYTTAPHSQQAPPEIPRFLLGAPRPWRFPGCGREPPLLATRLGVSCAASNCAADFPLYSIALPKRVHSICLSDNSSFWDYGYPALMITDTAFLRNPHYHLPTDTPDTLDYPPWPARPSASQGAWRVWPSKNASNDGGPLFGHFRLVYGVHGNKLGVPRFPPRFQGVPGFQSWVAGAAGEIKRRSCANSGDLAQVSLISREHSARLILQETGI